MDQRDAESATTFTGPLFIVGMPRSGTKLLRDLLNRHSRIAIPDNESHFIPLLMDHPLSLKPLENERNLRALHDLVSKTSFAMYQAEKTEWPTLKMLADDMTGNTYADFIEAIFHGYARRHGGTVWGDKTPQYIGYIGQLQRLFPAARFIHIVRDVRDYALSQQQVWRKNPFRAAQRWADGVLAARQAGKQLTPGQYIEVNYELLLREPESCLRTLCDFIGVEFEPQVTQLERPAENLGDTRHSTQLLPSNSGKWRTRLSSEQVQRIEEIAMPAMQAVGYVCEQAQQVRRIPGWRYRLYQLQDGLQLVRFRLQSEQDLRTGLRHLLSNFIYRHDR